MDSARIVIVGGGFAGYHAARTLQRLGAADITLINPTDYFLYLPLLPEVAGGILDPRRICVSLSQRLSRVRLVLGTVDEVGLGARRIGWTDPEGGRGEAGYDRLILTAGSVNKLLPVPGVAEHAHGFRGIGEALYLRDHIVRQLELAATTGDPAEREARCTFVVVGAGYTGTEVAAQGQLLTSRSARQVPGMRQQRMRWLLLDTAPAVLPGLDRRLSATADRVLRHRGVQVRTGQSIDEANDDGVRLSTGEQVATRSLIWCVGVRPDPLVSTLSLPTEQGRIVVDENLAVPGHPGIFACGDCAAVPDLTRSGELTAMTAQHAQRQGKRVAHNVAATLGNGSMRPYRHRDLGFLVDLGKTSAAANPLGIPLAGFPAKAITRAYHLWSMPGNRMRTANEWALAAVMRPPSVELGLVRAAAVPLETE